MNERFFDALGNEIKPGDYLAYPGHQGSRHWMNLGRVTGFELDPRKSPGVYMQKVELGGTYPAARAFTGMLHRAVIVPESQVPVATQKMIA